MQWIIAIVLALALSVPVGAALTAFGALVLEFVLGLLVEAGEKIAGDPQKKKIVVVILTAVLLGLGLCILIGCVALVLLIHDIAISKSLF